MWINLAAWFVEIFSGFLLWLVVPYGSKGSFIFDRLTWISIHKWDAIPITAIVILHVALHWKWIANQTKAIIRNSKRPSIRVPVPEPDSELNPEMD